MRVGGKMSLSALIAVGRQLIFRVRRGQLGACASDGAADSPMAHVKVRNR